MKRCGWWFPHHPLLHADVTLAEALSWPLVLSPRGTVPRQNAEALIVSHGLAVPEGCVETLSVTLARCLTLQYGYVWLVPYGAVRDDLFGNHLRALPLPTQGMAEPLGIITRQEAFTPLSSSAWSQRCVREYWMCRYKRLFYSTGGCPASCSAKTDCAK